MLTHIPLTVAGLLWVSGCSAKPIEVRHVSRASVAWREGVTGGTADDEFYVLHQGISVNFDNGHQCGAYWINGNVSSGYGQNENWLMLEYTYPLWRATGGDVRSEAKPGVVLTHAGK